MTKTFLLALALGLMALSVPALAQNNDWYSGASDERDEFSDDFGSPSYDSSVARSNCYGYSCDKNKDKDKDEPGRDPMQNSFSSGGAPKGSIGSMIHNQMQPR